MFSTIDLIKEACLVKMVINIVVKILLGWIFNIAFQALCY